MPEQSHTDKHPHPSEGFDAAPRERHRSAATSWRKGDIEINVGGLGPSSRSATPGTGRSRSGSHFHFFEVNRALEFDRAAALGLRLTSRPARPSLRARRPEGGHARALSAARARVYGFNNLLDGWTGNGAGYRPNAVEAIRRAKELGFKSGK